MQQLEKHVDNLNYIIKIEKRLKDYTQNEQIFMVYSWSIYIKYQFSTLNKLYV